MGHTLAHAELTADEIAAVREPLSQASCLPVGDFLLSGGRPRGELAVFQGVGAFAPSP